MNIAKIIICCLLLCALRVAAQEVVISGQFHSTQKEFKVEDISEFQYLQPLDKKLQVKTDQGGNFTVKMKLAKPGYYRIGRNILYLSPGDKLHADINHVDPSLSTFTGRGKGVNEYLKNTPFSKGGSYLESGRNINANPQMQLKAILEKEAKRKHALNQLTGASLLFKNLETARIRADVVNSIYSLSYYGPRKLKLSADSVINYLNTFRKAAQPILKAYLSSLNDPQYLQLVVFRDISGLVVAENNRHIKKSNKSINQIMDWIRADSLVNIMNTMEDKAKIAAFAPKLYSIKTMAYRNGALSLKTAMLAYGNGDQAKDFSAIDLEGNPVQLSDLKGKIIFVDLWATWCGPCLREMPAFESLKKQYQDNPQIVFISLSIDDSIQEWKKNVASRNATGLQWHISRNALTHYQINNIPRTIIIDQSFKIANFQAPFPSSKENISLLEKLLSVERVKSKFTIDGTLNSADANSLLFLSYVGKDRKTVRDSAKLDKGAFHFEGEAAETISASLLLSNVGFYSVKKNSDQTDLFVGGNRLTIKGEDSIATASITGDVENIVYHHFRNQLRTLEKSQMALLYALTPERRKIPAFIDSIKQENKGLVAAQKNLEKDFVINHPDLMASLAVLKSYAGPLIEVSDVAPLYDGLSKKVKESTAGKEFGKTITFLKTIAVGQIAPDFTAPDILGNTISLSDLKGKYVLIDFWASWCAPCRAENPNVKTQYQKYKKLNFEILGVSLDGGNAKAAWLKAVNDDGLSWINVCELQGFNSKIARLYHIDAIPQNFLIDPQGEIIAKNLRGIELEKALEKFIKK